MGLFKKIKKFFGGGKKNKAPKPNFAQLRTDLERERQLVVTQQAKLRDQLQALEKERLQSIEILKKAAKNLADNTQQQFTQIVSQDSKLAQEVSAQLLAQEKEFQAKEKIYAQFQNALEDFAQGQFGPIEALVKDEAVRQVVPERLQMFIEYAALNGRSEWVNIFKARKQYEDTQARLAILDAEQRQFEATLKELNDTEAGEHKLQAESHTTNTPSSNTVETKLTQEQTNVERKRIEELECITPHQYQTALNLAQRQVPLEERALGLLTFDLTQRGALIVKKELTVFSTNDELDKLKQEFDKTASLCQKELDVNSKRHDTLINFAQNIFYQFAEDYDYREFPVIHLVLSLAAIALIEKLKLDKTPEKEIAGLVEAALTGALARELWRNAMLQHYSKIIQSIAAYVTRLDWRSKIEVLLKTSNAPLDARPKILEEGLKFSEVISNGTYYDYYSVINFQNFMPDSRKFIPIWKNVLITYLEASQNKQHDLGDISILALAKKQGLEKILSESFETRLKHQKEFYPVKELFGKIAFQLCFEAKLVDIFSKKAGAEKDTQFQEQYNQASDLIKSGKYSYKSYDGFIDIAENVIAQVFPVPYLEPDSVNFKFNLLPVAMAIAKIRIIQLLDETLPEQELNRILGACLYAGFIRKLMSDFPERYSFGSSKDAKKFGSFFHPQFMENYFRGHPYYSEGYFSSYRGPESFSTNLYGDPTEEALYKFEFCHLSVDAHAEIGAIIELAMHPFYNRAEAFKTMGKPNSELLMQADLLETYHRVMDNEEYPSAYDGRIFQKVYRAYQVTAKFRNPKIEQETKQAKEQDHANNLKVLESSIFHMMKDDRFWHLNSLTTELSKILDSLKIKIERHDSRMTIFKESEQLKLCQKIGSNWMPLKNDLRYLLFLAKNGNLIRILDTQFGIKGASDNPQLKALQKKLNTWDLEIDYARNSLVKILPEVQTHEPHVQLAENILRQSLSQDHFDASIIINACALACIGISRALNGKEKNKFPENHWLVKAIAYMALFRIFYHKRVEGSLGNGANAGIYYGQTPFFPQRGKYFINSIQTRLDFRVHPRAHEPESVLGFILYDFREVQLSSFFPELLDSVLNLSALTNAARLKYLLDRGNQNIPTYFMQYSHTEGRYVDLRDYCNFIGVYRDLTATGEYPPGDPHILLEAQRICKIATSKNVTLAPSYRGPRTVRRGETFTVELQDFRNGHFRFINRELFDLESQYEHAAFGTIRETTLRGLQDLRITPILPQLVPISNLDLRASHSMSLQPWTSHSTTSRQPVLFRGNITPAVNTNTLQPHSNSTALVSHQTRGNDVQLQVRLTTSGIFEGYVNGRYESHWITVIDDSLLETPLRHEYSCHNTHTVKFKMALSGTLTLQQDDQDNELFLETFKMTDHVSFTPTKEGKLRISIKFDDMPDSNITKTVMIKPRTFSEQFRAQFQQPDWKNVNLSSEQAPDGVFFWLNNQPFFKVNHLAELQLWQDPVTHSAPVDAACSQEYEQRLRDLKQFFNCSSGNTSGSTNAGQDAQFAQRMSKAILSAHWLMSKDLMFGPLFALGTTLYYCQATHLIEPYLDLLTKQIALYEMLQTQGLDKTCDFIQNNPKIFPKYWAHIFKQTHQNREPSKAFLLLTMQTFLTVLKEESISFDAQRLLTLTQELLAYQNPEHYARAHSELLEEFREDPALQTEHSSHLYEHLADIHKRWGADSQGLAQRDAKVEKDKVSAQIKHGERQSRTHGSFARTRSIQIDIAQGIAEYFLECVKYYQEQFIAMEKTYAENREQIQAALNQLQKAIYDFQSQANYLFHAERDYERAKRKAKKKKRRMIIGTLVSCVASFFIPGLAQGLIAQLGRMGVSFGNMAGFATTVARGVISGGLNAALTGGNVGTAIFQNLILLGPGNAATSNIETLFKLETELAHIMVQAGVGAAVDTAFNGGNFIRNIAVEMGIAGVTHGLVPDTQQTRVFGPQGREMLVQTRNPGILGMREMVSSAQRATVRAGLGTIIRSAVNNTPITPASLGLTALTSGLNNFASTAGEQLAHQQELKRRQEHTQQQMRTNKNRQSPAQHPASTAPQTRNVTALMRPQTTESVTEVSDSNQKVARKQEKSRSAIPASQNKTAKTKSKTGNSPKPKNLKSAHSSSPRQLNLNSSSTGHSSSNLSSAHHLPANSSTQPERMTQPTIDVTRGLWMNPYGDSREITMPRVASRNVANNRSNNRSYNDVPRNATVRNQTPGPLTFSRTGNNIASSQNTRSFREITQLPAIPMSAQNDPRMPTSTGSRFTMYFANAVEGILNSTSGTAHASTPSNQRFPVPSFDLQNIFGTPGATQRTVSLYDISARRQIEWVDVRMNRPQSGLTQPALSFHQPVGTSRVFPFVDKQYFNMEIPEAYSITVTSTQRGQNHTFRFVFDNNFAPFNPFKSNILENSIGITSYDMMDFGKGVIKGSLMGAGLTAGMYGLNHFNTGKFILKRAGMVGVACMSAEALSVMTEFEQSAFSLSEEYRDVMMYAAVDKAQKLKFAQNVQIMEQDARTKLSESLNITRHFKENPEGFGVGLGLVATPFVASKPISKVVGSLTQAFKPRMHTMEGFAFQTATPELGTRFADVVSTWESTPTRLSPNLLLNTDHSIVSLHSFNHQPLGQNAWQKFRSTRTRITGGRSIGDEIALRDLRAMELYEKIRESSSDVLLIAKNLNLPEFQIQRVKNHVFYNKHKLNHGMGIARFDPDLEIAEAWKRLEIGNYRESDLLIFKHEHFESRFEGIYKTDYNTAHNAANRAGYSSGLKNEFDIEGVKNGNVLYRD